MDDDRRLKRMQKSGACDLATPFFCVISECSMKNFSKFLVLVGFQVTCNSNGSIFSCCVKALSFTCVGAPMMKK
jgi:hypothetical protein